MKQFGIEFKDGNEAAGKVLTSDASGIGTWQTPSSGGWSLTGNSGTVDGVDFLGTTDLVPLNFRVNGGPAGRIDATLSNVIAAIEKVVDVKLPSKIAFQLGRINEKIQPIKRAFDKTRNDLVINKYGVESETKGDFQVPAERLNEFIVELNELALVKETVETKLLMIEDFGTVELPVSFFTNMRPFMAE
jgi:hypothetical protein